MVDAYVLIQAEVGKGTKVAQDIAGIDSVHSADVVTGPYDVIARVEADSIRDLGNLVVAKIQALDGVTRTLTCPILQL